MSGGKQSHSVPVFILSSSTHEDDVQTGKTGLPRKWKSKQLLPLCAKRLGITKWLSSIIRTYQESASVWKTGSKLPIFTKMMNSRKKLVISVLILRRFPMLKMKKKTVVAISNLCGVLGITDASFLILVTQENILNMGCIDLTNLFSD
jgi:hypothetical protein